MPCIAFTIPGEPRGKGRPRASARIIIKDGEPEAVVDMHTPKETVQAERDVLAAFRRAHPRHQPFTGPVLMKFVAVFAIPASWPKRLKEAAARGTLYSIKKPDKDNIEKLIADALKGWAWVDDQQVMGGGLKRYGHPARTEVILEPLPEPDVAPTPAQRRLEARVDAREDQLALPAPRNNSHKVGKKEAPTQLQLRIDAALARDARERRR